MTSGIKGSVHETFVAVHSGIAGVHCPPIQLYSAVLKLNHNLLWPGDNFLSTK